MKLLTSKIPPLNTNANTFYDAFFNLLTVSDKVDIASGYISADSLAELQQYAEKNTTQNLHINLVMGMHYFEGITKAQYNAAAKLNAFLTDTQTGQVVVVRDFKFHGKIYSFAKNGTTFSTIIGSSNLDNISKVHSSFEIDVVAEREDTAFLRSVDSFMHDLNDRSVISISEWTPNFIQGRSALEGYDNVNKISLEETNRVFSGQTAVSFDIPLKTEPKSSLNVFFGKGRMNKNGLVIPRPWYEIELIVSKEITSQSAYPHGSFTVYTKDGWRFECYTSGDYYKNLRSSFDLQILGRWIKGQMEEADVIKPGDLITETTLDDFQKHALRLTKTTQPDIWCMELV